MAAQLMPLVMSAEGGPAVVLLDIKDGEVVPPHATKSHLRLQGRLDWVFNNGGAGMDG